MGRHGKCVREVAAIASHKTRVCLITTSSGKHWVIPKGRVAHGDRPWETVAHEAWEEAGIVGKAKRRPVGTYFFLKAGRLYKVTGLPDEGRQNQRPVARKGAASPAVAAVPRGDQADRAFGFAKNRARRRGAESLNACLPHARQHGLGDQEHRFQVDGHPSGFA